MEIAQTLKWLWPYGIYFNHSEDLFGAKETPNWRNFIWYKHGKHAFAGSYSFSIPFAFLKTVKLYS